MARKRMLSPEFFTSAPVNRLTIPAMVTFAGLWCYFDDYGRGEDDAALIKAAVWPRRKAQSERQVDADLDAIESEGLICRYQIGNVPLIHSPSWDEHQKPSHRTPSKLPPCPTHEQQEHANYLRQRGDGRDRFRKVSGITPEAFPSSSGPAPPSRARGSLVQESLGELRGSAPPSPRSEPKINVKVKSTQRKLAKPASSHWPELSADDAQQIPNGNSPEPSHRP